MDMKEEIEELLNFIKQELANMNLDATDIFMNGDCGNLYFIFADEFPRKAIPYRIFYKGEPYHIITKIGEAFYDINGETSIEKYAEYLQTHNDKEFNVEDFTMTQIQTFEVRMQSDLYRYNDDYEQSEIENDMYHLNSTLKSRRREKEEEER